MPSSPSQVHRSEEKLGLILGQVRSVRTRLNGLAIQQGLFESLSLIIGTGAIVFIAAFLLGPLKFLTIATILGAVLLVGLSRAIGRAYRTFTTAERAAQLADERAGMKGRLATVVSLARSAPDQARLWPYLLEDTLSLRDAYAPGKVEPRRISRSLYGLLAYCLIAALVVAFALMNRRVQMAAKSGATELQADVNDLDVRPADPDLGTAVEITGDAAAMRKLADKLAAADQRQGESGSVLGKLIGRAEDLADNIQDRLTGHQSTGSRIRLKLTDSNSRARGSKGNLSPRTSADHPDDDGSGQSQRQQAGSVQNPMAGSIPGQQNFAARNPGQNGQSGEPVPNDPSKNALAQGENDDRGGGGSSHGSGSDPQHLFGQADEPPLGSEGFELMIEARPAERGAKGLPQSSLPPKVRAALNPSQHPDEPIARSSVPEDDRAAIKRVFDR